MADVIVLQAALQAACVVAIAHGVDQRIDPDAFGIQTSPEGTTHATYVDADHLVSVWLDRNDCAVVRIADLSWTHWPDTDSDDDAECDVCQPYTPQRNHFRGVPIENAYLPGDAPVSENANV
ncbi:hypothetical protein [Nocardia sp. NBC_01388]|uniref:hypothetical protein n=1 Tax=Nocardia sp. NBC_01388 TaxID=2903596 RepID=UPI00324C210F